jgi:hypothetical protein
LLSLLNYDPWKIRGRNTGQHGEISNAKTKIAEHHETSLITARGIADLMVMFRYSISGAMAGAGTLGVIHCNIHEQTGDEGAFMAVRGDLTMTMTHN